MDRRTDGRRVGGWRRDQSCCSDCSMVRFPGIRPTAEVVAILNNTPRRAQVVGILRAEGGGDVLRLTPCDPRMPHMMVNASSMPAEIQQRLLVRPSALIALCSGKLWTLQSLNITLHGWMGGWIGWDGWINEWMDGSIDACTWSGQQCTTLLLLCRSFTLITDRCCTLLQLCKCTINTRSTAVCYCNRYNSLVIDMWFTAVPYCYL